MRTKMSKSLIVLLLTIVLGACSTNEETSLIERAIENQDTNGANESEVIDMDDERYLLAEHFSEDNEIEMDIVELVDGGYSIGLFFKPHIDKEKVAVYSKLISEVRAGKITLDEMYSRLEGPTANKESINKLKTFQKKINENSVSVVKDYNKTKVVLLENRAEELDCDFPQPCGGTREPQRSINHDHFVNHWGYAHSELNSDWVGRSTVYVKDAIFGGSGYKFPTRSGRYYRVIVFSSYATKAESHVKVYINEKYGVLSSGYGILKTNVPPYFVAVLDYVKPNGGSFSSEVNMCPTTCFKTYHVAFTAH